MTVEEHVPLAAGVGGSWSRLSAWSGQGHPVPLRIPNVAIHDALIWGACAIVVFVVVIALAGRTAPTWPLAVTALMFSVLLFVGEIVDNLPIVQPRYVTAPALLLYTAIVAMLRPRGLAYDASTPGGPDAAPSGDAPAAAAAPAGASRRAALTSWTPVTVFALQLAVVAGFNYRVINNRSEPAMDRRRRSRRERVPEAGMGDYDYRHAWWLLQIPCSRV